MVVIFHRYFPWNDCTHNANKKFVHIPFQLWMPLRKKGRIMAKITLLVCELLARLADAHWRALAVLIVIVRFGKVRRQYLATLSQMRNVVPEIESALLKIRGNVYVHGSLPPFFESARGVGFGGILREFRDTTVSNWLQKRLFFKTLHKLSTSNLDMNERASMIFDIVDVSALTDTEQCHRSRPRFSLQHQLRPILVNDVISHWLYISCGEGTKKPQ